MNDRWAYPIQLAMQRQTGSAPRPAPVPAASASKSPTIDSPTTAPDELPVAPSKPGKKPVKSKT